MNGLDGEEEIDHGDAHAARAIADGGERQGAQP